ncbi:MAG: ABC transporter substrate-binding protein [Myxococcales bacterium]|nr:ABC transporter substrate-binding protein [Myxococcales bacterium]
MSKATLYSFFAILGILLTASLTACTTPIDKPKPQDKFIYVKGLFDLTGATSDVGVSYSRGVLDSIEETNANGGIEGYKIDIDWKDYGYVANKAVEIYDAWKKDTDKPLSGAVTIFGWGTGDSVILSPKVAEDKIPYVSASYAGSLASPQAVNKEVDLPDGSKHVVETKGAPYNFFAGTDYSTSIRLAMQFIKDSGGKKVAFIYCNAGYCKEPIPAGKTFAKEIGLEIAGDIEVNLDFTREQASDAIKAGLEKLQVSEADNLWAWLGNTAKTAVYSAQGFAKHAPTNARMISNVWGFDESVPGRCKDGWDGSGDACVDKLFGVMPFAAFGDLNYPEMKSVVVQHKKYRDQAKEDATLYADVRYIQGYASFLIWRRVVEKLLKDGKEVTGPNIKEAFESFGTLSTGGLTLNLGFTADNHRPSSGALIYAVGGDGKLSYKKEVSVSLKPEWKGW